MIRSLHYQFLGFRDWRTSYVVGKAPRARRHLHPRAPRARAPPQAPWNSRAEIEGFTGKVPRKAFVSSQRLSEYIPAAETLYVSKGCKVPAFQWNRCWHGFRVLTSNSKTKKKCYKACPWIAGHVARSHSRVVERKFAV